MELAQNRVKSAAIISAIMVGLTGCSLFSNDGYDGGDHRGGGPTGPLTGTEMAKKIDPEDIKAEQDENAPYVGGDHRGGGPTGPLSGVVTDSAASSEVKATQASSAVESSTSVEQSSDLQESTEAAETSADEEEYLGGDHRGGGPVVP